MVGPQCTDEETKAEVIKLGHKPLRRLELEGSMTLWPACNHFTTPSSSLYKKIPLVLPHIAFSAFLHIWLIFSKHLFVHPNPQDQISPSLDAIPGTPRQR